MTIDISYGRFMSLQRPKIVVAAGVSTNDEERNKELCTVARPREPLSQGSCAGRGALPQKFHQAAPLTG